MKYSNNNNLPIANLPFILKEAIRPFKTSHEKMIILLGAITALSGLCFKVKGYYRDQRVHPNLFLFILAQFASGKSALNYARKLVQKIHEEIKNNSLAELKLYLQQTKNKKDSESFALEKPPMRVALIPANVTSAKLIEHLAANEGKAPSVMIESELDTLSAATRSEHGNFSDTLRKVFQNEPVSFSRKGNSEFFEVICSFLSLAMAGTLNQFTRFITNSEDGLLSRFLVYKVNTQDRWSSVAPSKNTQNLDGVFDRLSTTVYEYYQYLKVNDLTISLTFKQWQRLDAFGQHHLNKNKVYSEQNSSGIVKRHALMIYKICLTLTALRMAESKCKNSTGLCSDEDFNLALFLGKESLENSLDLLPTLPTSFHSKRGFNREEFYNKLASEFQRSQAIEVGSRLNVSARSVDRFLEEMIEKGELLWQSQGKYKKP